MNARALAVCSLFFMAAPIPSVSGAPDDAVRVEVEQPQLVVDNSPSQSPYLTGYKLAFDARFTNQGNALVEIPGSAATGGVAGISQNGVESQQSDGSWRTVENGGDLMWKGDTIFPMCKSLSPKAILAVKGLSGPFVVFKSNLRGLGPTATIRLYLVLPCKQQDGKVISKTVRTAPFVLSIPPLP